MGDSLVQNGPVAGGSTTEKLEPRQVNDTCNESLEKGNMKNGEASSVAQEEQSGHAQLPDGIEHEQRVQAGHRTSPEGPENRHAYDTPQPGDLLQDLKIHFSIQQRDAERLYQAIEQSNNYLKTLAIDGRKDEKKRPSMTKVLYQISILVVGIYFGFISLCSWYVDQASNLLANRANLFSLAQICVNPANQINSSSVDLQQLCDEHSQRLRAALTSAVKPQLLEAGSFVGISRALAVNFAISGGLFSVLILILLAKGLRDWYKWRKGGDALSHIE